MYCCQRCGKGLASKQNLINHLKRKFPCNPDLSQESTDSLLKTLIVTDSDSCVQKPDFCCKYGCGKVFKHKNNMYVHLKTCSKKDDTTVILSKLVTQIQKLERRLEDVPGTTIINNNNTKNTQVNIAMRDFAVNENLEYIPNRFLYNCFSNKNLQSLVEEIHFNPQHPENHNVRVKNVKLGLMEYFDDGEWKVGKKQEVLNNLTNNGWRVLNSFYGDHREKIECKMDTHELDECLEWLNDVSSEDSKLNKELKCNLFCMVVGKKAYILRRD
jgi:hypothetical protein